MRSQRVPASLSLELVASLSEQQNTVRTDAMVYNELTDVEAPLARAAARLNPQLLRRELRSARRRRSDRSIFGCELSRLSSAFTGRR